MSRKTRTGADRDIFTVPPGTCPACGHVHDRAGLAALPFQPADVSAPRPGDLSVCADCHAINVFRDGGELWPATADQQKSLPPWIQIAIAEMKRKGH